MIFGYKPGNFSPKSGTVVPTTVVPNFIGQIYIDTVKDVAYVSYGLAAGEWLPQSVGLLDYMGAWDASGGTYPIAGSGSGGEVRQGDLWVISVQGTLGGETIHVGDMIIANTDDPEQVAANWDHINGNISYVPEDEANKVTSISSSSTDVEYPSAKLVYDQLLLKMTRITSVDNTLPRFDGTDGSVKSTNILVDDSDNVSAVGTLGCGAITSTGTLALGANSITMSGSIGVDGTRVTKGWFTDLEVTNDITIGGNALATIYQPLDGTLTAIAGLTIGANELIYGTGVDAFSMLAVNATATNKFLRQVSSGALSWEALVAGDIPDILSIYLPLAGGTMTGGITFGDPGTDLDSYAITLIADDGGMAQSGTIQIANGVNPYIRFSPPNASGAATATVDMRSDLISMASDNTVDLGAAAEGRLKDIYIAGSLGATASRVTKGWFTDLESTNDITINGNALSTLFAPIDIDASDIAVAEIGTATHDNVQDYINNITSSGRVSGGTIVDDADGTITVGAGTGYVKIADSDISETKAFDWAQSTTVSLVDKNINYIYITNATGTPVVSSTITRSSIPTTWAFTLGRVYKDGTTLSIINSGTNLDNHIRDNHERLVNVRYFEHSSGAAIAESGNRYITSTDGVFYIGANRTITTAKDTTGADTITYWYQDSGTGWTTGTESVMNNLNYDDGDGTLGTIGVAKYSARYVYIDFAGNLHYQFGQQSDRLRTTKAETLPTPPNFLAEFATLAAKIIVVKSGTNFTSVQSAFDTALSYNGVYDHNDLSNLQGGAAGERYHTTLAQYTIAIQAATTALDGYLSSTDWNTFNGKSDKLTDQSFTPTAGQTSFVLSTVPTNNAQIFMLVNNAVYVVGNDFTISGVTITWLDHFVMETTDVVTVRYP